MKNCLKKIMICVMAVACACSVHISVNAAPNDNPLNWDAIGNLISSLLNPNNTTQPAETTTVADPNTTTEPNATTTDPVNNMGTGTVPSSSTTNYPTVAPNQDPVGELTTVPHTTEPFGEEDSSYGSLIGLLEQDSAAVIVQTPTETFTLNAGLVVNNGEDDDGFTWQQAALIAAAVLFVILAALIGALIVQRSKRIKEEEEDRRRQNNMASSSSSAPVPVEVMTPERIAELLGSAVNANRTSAPSPAPSAPVDMLNMTSEESAAAIKAAILMGQLSHSYSDPLIRKYTEEPVMFSPVSKVNLDDGVTGAQILEATDSMLSDITGNEKYASDISGLHVSTDNIDDILAEDAPAKVCPECQNPVPAGDVFCHACGAYVG